MKKVYLVDTNVLVRFFTGEPPSMAKRAHTFFKAADQGSFRVLLLPMIIAETLYTLESFYQLPPKEVTAKMTSFIQSRGIQVEGLNIVIEALQMHQTHRVHFADAYLAAYAKHNGENQVVTFDRDFDKFSAMTRLDPGSI